MRSLLTLGLLVAVAFPVDARAAWPDDVSLTQLGTWNGAEVTDPKAMGSAYEAVVKQMAVGITNKPMQPAETLGVNGFAVTLDSEWGFIDAHNDDSDSPAPWQRTHVDGDPTRVLWIPTLGVRKGLPFSLEGGAQVGYVAWSHQTVFGAYGRWGIWEGYRYAPDLTVRVGYSGLVGNDQLELGSMDLGFTLGYSVPFGRIAGINESTFSPYLTAGLIRIHADPRLDPIEQEHLGIGPVSGFPSSQLYEAGAGFAPFTGSVGFRIRTGDVTVTLAGMGVVGVMATANMGFGYDF